MEKVKKNRRQNGKNFVVQGSILATAGILVRLIGMLYRIPLTNIIGDMGIGNYSSAYSIYSIVLIVSSYSMPSAVSKMVAIRLARKEYQSSIRILKASLAYATLVGGVAAGFMWFGADAIAGMNQMPYSSFAIKTLAPTVWVMAYLGVLRGYFQGQGTMIPTAISQIGEQVVNAAVSIAAALFLFQYGLKADLVYDTTEYSYSFGAAGGTIGTGAGAFTAFLLLLLLLLAYRPNMKRQMRRDRSGYTESYAAITGMLFFTVVPIVVSSTIYNISTVLDNAIYGQVMNKLGQEAASITKNWGIYMGKYHVLFNIPVGIANALSSSLIPSLSSAVAEGKKKQIREKIGTAIRFSMILAIPSAAGLMALAKPISNLLFRTADNAMLIHLLLYGSSAVIVFSLSTVTNAVLQGLNHMRMPIINASISLVLHLIILYIMLAVFHMGIESVVYSNIIFALMVCLLNASCIRKLQRYHQEMKKTFMVPAISAVFMGVAAKLVFELCYRSLGFVFGVTVRNLIGVLAAIFVAVLVYGGLLIKLGGINREELMDMPKGAFLEKIALKLHLL